MARTLLVSAWQAGAYPTIGAALQAVQAGETISLAPGEYTEAVVVHGMTVSLVAAEQAGSVTIDATSEGRPAVTSRDGEVLLRGLVLRSGDAPAVSASGGVLRLEECGQRQ